MEINEWLEKFKYLWINKDLQGVMSLFSDDVTYFETPFLQLKSMEEIFNEWKVVLEQESINFDYSVFSETNRKSTILWDLSYTLNGNKYNYKGIYLIKLNDQGLCRYFHQTCEGQE